MMALLKSIPVFQSFICVIYASVKSHVHSIEAELLLLAARLVVCRLLILVS